MTKQVSRLFGPAPRWVVQLRVTVSGTASADTCGVVSDEEPCCTPARIVDYDAKRFRPQHQGAGTHRPPFSREQHRCIPDP